MVRIFGDPVMPFTTSVLMTTSKSVRSNALPTRCTETGNSDLDLRNRFVLSGTYEAQAFKHSHGLERLALAGWQSNIIWVWNAGSPFSITSNYSYPGNSVYGGSGLAPGPNRPLQLPGVNPKLAHRTINQWFNPLAFETPIFGQPGNAPRNSLTGPTFESVGEPIEPVRGCPVRARTISPGGFFGKGELPRRYLLKLDDELA